MASFYNVQLISDKNGAIQPLWYYIQLKEPYRFYCKKIARHKRFLFYAGSSVFPTTQRKDMLSRMLF